MKPLRFIGGSRDDLSPFPSEVRKAAGMELWQVQNGLMPSDFKPMLTIGAGVYEIRVRVLGGMAGAVCRQIHFSDICVARLSEENVQDFKNRY